MKLMFEILRSLRLWHLELFSFVKLRTLKTRREGKITKMRRLVIITSLGGHRHIQVGELAALHHGWSDEMYFYLSKIFLYKEGFSNFLLWDLHIFVQGSGRRSPNFSRPAWHMSIDTKVDGIRCAKMKLRFWLVVKKEDIGSRILKC